MTGGDNRACVSLISVSVGVYVTVSLNLSRFCLRLTLCVVITLLGLYTSLVYNYDAQILKPVCTKS